MKIIIRHKKFLPEVVKALLKITEPNRLFAFYGPMGSGKTTIIKAICRELGASDHMSSPSFTIVNEYSTTAGETLYHIDFYRIKKQEEVFDFGIEEYFSAGCYCFIEWPEKIANLLPSSYVRVTIKDQDSKRVITLEQN